MPNLNPMTSSTPTSPAKNGKSWRLAGAGLLLVGLGAGALYFNGHHADSAAESTTGKGVNTAQSQVPRVALAPSEAPKAVVAPLAPVGQSHPEVTAVVQLAEHKSVTLEPNALGLFPRVLLAQKQTVPITVTYPDGEPGEVLVISAEDGGKVNGTSPVQTAKLDSNRQVHFKFNTTQNEGVYHVTVRRGAEQQQFDFWVGTEPALQTVPTTL